MRRRTAALAWTALAGSSMGFLAMACGGSPTGSCGFEGCGTPCSSPTASQRWTPDFASAASEVAQVNGALEATMHVNEQESLLLLPVGANNICPPPATWTSTNPKAASFKSGDPTAGTVTEQFGDSVLFGIAPGDTTVYVVVDGVRYDLVYANLNEPIRVVHVVP
jgi:hypothetical protein